MQDWKYIRKERKRTIWMEGRGREGKGKERKGKERKGKERQEGLKLPRITGRR